jgi:hypothetical protein
LCQRSSKQRNFNGHENASEFFLLAWRKKLF